MTKSIKNLSQLPSCGQRMGSVIVNNEGQVKAIITCNNKEEINPDICNVCGGLKIPSLEIIREIISGEIENNGIKMP
jgi:hypothetical protein